MKIFASALEAQSIKREGQRVYLSKYIVDSGVKLKWNLMSYFYLKNHYGNAEFIRENSELVIIDSGAHTFQFGKKVDFEQYTHQYADFIRRFDRDNVVGFFEMDIENVIGYDEVRRLRKILEQASDKIIPVWHPGRGIPDYLEMCKEYAGKVIAIGGFRGTDIKDNQFLMFLKTAKKYGCKVHCLGMTRTEVLDRVPFDYTDSATWITAANMGHPLINGRQIRSGKGGIRFPKATGEAKFGQFLYNYKEFQNSLQTAYYKKWIRECKD